MTALAGQVTIELWATEAELAVWRQLADEIDEHLADTDDIGGRLGRRLVHVCVFAHSYFPSISFWYSGEVGKRLLSWLV
ncbi:hypothetical protein [Denitromonas sp.]|uniref:hypothetical protein n=1 Tax=Denitromonas sp. TaxID=2734609 RepID=UPI003A8BA8BD